MAMSQKNMATVKAALKQCDSDQLIEISDELKRLYKTAVRIEGAVAARELRVGMRVKFKSGRRPAYLSGETGIIEEFRSTRLLIKLDRGPVGKFKSGRVIATPLSIDILEGP